jgi:hypothetical protein
MRIAAALTWIVIVNAIFTFMLARLDEPNVTRAQAVGLLDAPNAKPVKLDEGRELLREEDLNYASYSANQLFFRPLGSDRTLYPLVDQPGNLSFIAGHCQVRTQKLNIAHREFLIEGEESARARIETYNYPHWVARLDGQEIKIGAEQGSGLMLLDLPAGKHRITLDYEVRQPSQRIARAISAVAWAGFLIWALSLATQRSRRKRISAQ